MATFEVPRKMKEWSLWALWCLLISGAVLWLFVGSVAYWVKQGWLPDDAAGWTQAIGAILAVVVAITVPALQKRYEMKLTALAERRKRLDGVYAVLSLTQNLFTHFEVAIQRMGAAPDMFVDKRAQAIQLLAHISRSCVDLELLAFGSEMVPYVLRIKSAALYAEQLAREPLGFPRQWEQAKRELSARVRDLRRQEEELVEYSDALER